MSDNKPKNRPKHLDVFTLTVPCPSCGATVEFASTGSVMSVCGYCQTTVVREGEDVKAQGKQSLTIEDYSPLQLGSSGTYGKHNFVILGRIQLSYSDGIWNEWFIQFDNGKTGWLSEALGQYSLTLDKGEHPELPNYDELGINNTVHFADISYTVTDKRTAKAIAGEGELPFIVGDGWETWVIDARMKRRFITLDYAENGASGAPTVYQGAAVKLEQLNMQLLKSDRQLSETTSLGGGHTASNIKREEDISKLECPNCGSPVPYIAGATNCLICPACHSEIQLTGTQAELIKVHSMMQSYLTSLKLGDQARIYDSELVDVISTLEQKADVSRKGKYHDYVIIGIMRLKEVGENARWTEYLLYSKSNGFLWLSEESTGWFVSRVLNELPERKGSKLIFDGKKWRRLYDESYASQVYSAIGAFNWQVKLGDSMILDDYSDGKRIITTEQNDEEITYSIAAPVSVATINTWFGTQLSLKPKKENRKGDVIDGNVIRTIFVIIVILIILFGETNDDSTFIYYPSGTSSSSDRTGYTSSGSHK